MKLFKRMTAVALSAMLVSSIAPITKAASIEWEMYAWYTSDTTFVPPVTGKYRIICVGKSGDGGDGHRGGSGSFNYQSDGYTGGSGAGGSSGAIAVSDLDLTKGTSYKLTFTDGISNFNGLLRAEAGADGPGGDYDRAGKPPETNAKAYGGNVINREGFPGGQGGGDDQGYTIQPTAGGNSGGKLSNTTPSGFKGGGGARYPDVEPIRKYLKPASAFVPDGFCSGGGYGRENKVNTSSAVGPSHGGNGQSYLTWRDDEVVLTGGGGGGASGRGQPWGLAGSNSSPGAGQGGTGGKGQPAIIIIERAKDSTPPTINSVGFSTAWTTQLQVTVNATDTESGVVSYAVTTSNAAPASGWQSSNKFTLYSNATYYAWAKDAIGNVSAGKPFNVTCIDITCPVVNSITVPSTWGKTSKVTINATDVGGGVANYAVTTSNISPSVWQASSSFTLNANGTYYAWAKDGAGNVSGSKQFTVSKVDTTIPVVNVVNVPNIWGSTSSITIDASDSGSGVSTYAVTNSNTAPGAGWQAANSFTLSANGTYYAWAKDAAGNISAGKQFAVSKIDTIVPIVNSVDVPDIWERYSTIKINASDVGCGIASYAITNTNIVPGSGWQPASQFTLTANGTYYAWAKDGAGNISADKSFHVSKVDTTAPVVDSVTVPDVWSPTSTVTLNATDVGSGIVSYAVTTSDTQPLDGWQTGNSFTLLANGTYYAWAKDKVGLVSASKAFTVSKVDDQAPSVLDVKVPTSWDTSSVITIEAEDHETSVVAYAYTLTDQAPVGGWQESNKFTIIANGTYYAWAKDIAGNVSIGRAFIVTKVDRTSPVITEIQIPETWGQTATIKVVASDEQSGIAQYGYTTKDIAPDSSWDQWQTSSSLTLSKNGTYYAWAMDAVGNVSVGKQFTIEKVDTTKPTIDEFIVADNGETATVKASDQGGSTLKGILVNGILHEQNPLVYSIPDGIEELTVQAVDIAGNKSEEVTKHVPDIKPPTIDSVTFTEDGKLATILASDTGSSRLKGVYVNGELQPGSPIYYNVPHGVKYLELQAEDNAGNKSPFKTKRVPGWSQITSMVKIKSVDFNEDITAVTVFATSSEAESEVTGIYADGILYPGNGITCPIQRGATFLQLQAINNFGDRSEQQTYRIPGWWDTVDTLTIDPVVFAKDGSRATITARNTAQGIKVAGIYVNGEFFNGSPINYIIPHGTEALELQAENSQGDRSIIYTVTVPGLVSKSIEVEAIEFLKDQDVQQEPMEAAYSVSALDDTEVVDRPAAALIRAKTEGEAEVAGIIVNEDFVPGNPAVYTIPEGTKHLRVQATSEQGELSPLVVKRVPGWSQIVDTITIKTVKFQKENTVAEITAEDKTGKQIYGVYVNDEFVPGNPATYQIPEGTTILKMQAMNEDGDLSAIVNRAVPGIEDDNGGDGNGNGSGDGDGDGNGSGSSFDSDRGEKKTLKVTIHEPEWTNQNRAKVRITASDKNSDIDEIEATSGESDDWADITSTKYIYIKGDTTVYARATNEKGDSKEISKDIECFDYDPPNIAASLDKDILNVRVTDTKSGVDKVVIGGNTYSAAEARSVIRYRVTDEASVDIVSQDKAGNIRASTFELKKAKNQDEDATGENSKPIPHTGRGHAAARPWGQELMHIEFEIPRKGKDKDA